MSGEKGEGLSDKRLEFIKERIASGFPKLGNKLDKAFLSDEVRETITSFFEDEYKRCLVVPETLKIDNMIPSKPSKSKTLMFIKLTPCVIKMDNINTQLALLELGTNPFEHLELIANEVFLPVLSNPHNQAKWGEVPTREIMDRFHNFLSSTTILCGQIKGETRLPMPPVELSGGSSTGKNHISLLEGAIITWTKQIRSVLKQDPETQLKQGMHPTPDVEIEFWRNKASNLNSIFEQLQGSRIRRVLKALDQSKSTYCSTFARLCKEVFSARMEANDNTKYLRTLECWFKDLNNEDDFPKTVDLFKPMLHIILLIWKNSKHYHNPNRLIVLMREICNSLIKQATKYVPGEQIFVMIENEEANQAVNMLKTTINVCNNFKATYTEYKNTANAECPANPWKMQNNSIFMRLDSFLERCHDILDLTQTIVQFSKLSKIEVGGTKGKSLTTSIKQIYDDFLQAVSKFKSVPYDIMDVGAKAFDDDFYEFRCSIKELERRLGAVVSLAFDDCSNVYGKFKLLDSFEGLLERPIIQDELEKKYIGLVQSYGADLKAVQELFLHHRDACPIAWNLPPIAGALTWCRGLMERIEIPFVKLSQLDKNILEREEAKEVSKVYHNLKSILQDFECQKIEEWGRDVEQSSQSKLKLPLLTRNPENRLLEVNFDPTLVRLLREVKYFLLLGLSVPDTALEIYQQVEVFRSWTGNLDLIVNMNNDVLNILLPVERPLALPYLTKFDNVIEKGVSTLNWKSGGITEFISDAMEQVKTVSEVARTMKTNLKGITEQLALYNKPLIARKPKPIMKEEFEKDHKNFIKERYSEIKECGKNIHNMLKDTNKVLRVSNASSDWKAYVDFVNNVVVDGLTNVVYTSLNYLHDQIDPVIIQKEEKLPLIEIKLDLVSVKNGDDDVRRDEVRFIPDLGENNGKGVRDLVNNWIGSFFHITTLFKRLDNEGSYLREIHTDHSIKVLLTMINDTIEKNDKSCMEVLAKYDSFSYLWKTDLAEHFAKFVEEASIVTPKGQTLPNLEKFNSEIIKYEQIRDQIQKFQSPLDIGWLRINTQPVKSQLITWSSRWIDLFNNYLKKIIHDKLYNLSNFMTEKNRGLDVEVVENTTQEGKNALMAVMEDIRDVRKVVDVTKELFVPLQEALNILKIHGIDISTLEKINGKLVQDYLDEVPIAWDSFVKKTDRKKEDILPLQLSEVENLKEDLDKFYTSVKEFRSNFKTKAPFAFKGSPEEAYAMIDSHASVLLKKQAEALRFNELEELFDLQVSKYSEMNDTKVELKLLKSVWDMKSLILNTYSSWNNQLWNDIETESLTETNMALQKSFRRLGAETPIVKAWGVYANIDELLKNMSVSLPLINELHSSAMRDRHWASIEQCCHSKKIDPNDPKFTFENMISLELHRHKEDVEEVIETANKELKIEKKLKDIESIWSVMSLEYVPHNETELYLVKLSEEVMESLESHQLELQGMIGMGKFVEFFRDRVLQWQSTLGSVEDVLKVWTNVTRSWTSLESIFLASADIRSQLPDDTKRFEGIDSEFKELMKDAINIPIVTQVCLVDGRKEALCSMMSRLEQCQKSLNEYLDQKKKIFPRFYFVSNVALLDMLANGTNPPKIMKYLGDCYDSLDDLEFVTDENGVKNTKLAYEMVAKDKERLMLHAPFPLEGEVERYLNDLTESMRTTLKYKMQEGYTSAGNWEVDKPRHEWLFYLPAQVVVTTTQIYWTEETETALEDLAGGQEDAVKRYLNVCDVRLQELIKLVLGELSKGDRVKIITIITLDVHARDVIQKLIDEKVEGIEAFLWQQQLRFYWVPGNLDTEIRICDFRTKYFYEWIGNTGRLVITPLTDRCYVTLTMGLRLFLGGAPAGPAGTGKTETTKDLARALALPCYVFNCSDQMNYQTMADIFRGLAQTGTWGCFDEFNRISIEVLSVVATQVKTVQDCIKKLAIVSNREPEFQHLPAGLPPVKIGNFSFEGDTISLVPTCGFFITMNPGYAGRTELPENLKVLFRSCAMIRPDLKLICENMLMSEGFQSARVLAIKFVTLYELSSELLSKQAHYDWGLRAVKSVLRVAGSLKRGEPTKSEDELLMRALRDFNTPKIPAQDTPIFLRLISDLFMGLDAQLKVNDKLKEIVHVVTKEDKLQTDEAFILKVLQFQELLDVRHSVMLLGPTGCGKTTIWKTLVSAHNWDTEKKAYKAKKTCVYETVNPKAVTGDELYGYMTLSKDWKDGVLSIIMRGMAKNVAEQGFHDYQSYKWVVLDGDIDAVWIESMNTVMDDNKVLTLVSNERIPLSDSMRMVFEINSLKNATPATVSRAGILYINETDIGWRPFVDSWLAKRDDPTGTEKASLRGFFEKYIDATNDSVRKGFKECTPIYLLNKVCTIVYLLEGLLETVPIEKKTYEVIENIFIFCVIWSFGGPMVVDKSGDSRKYFSETFSMTFGQKFPKEKQCFDYVWSLTDDAFVDWSSKIPKYDHTPIGALPGQSPFTQLFVPTSDTIRLTFLMDTLARKSRHVMLVGSGSGKTVLINKYLQSLNKEVDGFLSTTINMSYYTDSKRFQEEIELPIDKRSGRRYGPPASKRLIIFIDDLNLPYIETYGTQNAIALLTQHMSYGTIFDRSDLGLRKELVDIQYMAAMNPTAGSFTICERAQRHFATFACLMPSRQDLTVIFRSLLSGHVQGFSSAIVDSVDKIVDASLTLYDEISKKFLPSAVKFTYNWNLRELTNVFQGLCLMKPENFNTFSDIVKLWIHEFNRVISDRFFNISEFEPYDAILTDVMKKNLGINNQDDYLNSPIIFTTFTALNSTNYQICPSMDELKKTVDMKLIEYNESNAMMDLVLFEQAAEHIARISRIISNPSGNAMLIGVGGSGKQSLSRLAAFINEYEVRQLQVTGSFRVDDLLENLKEIFKACSKNNKILFLMTDTQIIDDRFLIYINAILASGWISGLFAKDEIDALLGNVRNEAKAVLSSFDDSPETLLKFLISKLRSNLHIVLCFSPVGDVFRVRARRFPALIYNTSIDFFHPWPREALISVARKFLVDVELPDDSIRESLSIHMAEEHLSVTNLSKKYLETQGRYNYVTPKSYLELIGFYKHLLSQKRAHISRQIERLDVGLSTLRKTAADVAELKVNLTESLKLVEEKQAATNILIQDIGVQKNIADQRNESANIEAQKAAEASEIAASIEQQAESELSQATPAMEAARAAVYCLNKAMLTELKSLGSPPAGVDLVTSACLILVEREYKNFKWDRAKKMMANVDQFKARLQALRGEDITEEEIKKVEPFINNDLFDVKIMESKSMAAANLCNWVINIVKFNRIYVKVKPLMDQLEEARASKAAAEASLEAAKATVEECDRNLKALSEKLEAATIEKNEVEAQAENGKNRLSLAERLVNGLSSENERWGKEIESLKNSNTTLIGDCMLAAGFVSYVGSFDQVNREFLWRDTWYLDLTEKKVPITLNIDPLSVLTNDGINAKMISQGLPADRISIENGSIIMNCKRWPLLIDPQTQGIKWLRKKEEDNGLEVFQLNQKGWQKKVEQALAGGKVIIIENLGEDIDATLDPVLSRAIIKKGRNISIRFCGEDIEYDPKFQLYLQTKLSNPHYKPEIAAQCTLINFIATERGLEDQLLAKAVGAERPELEEKAQALQASFQQYKIQLVQLEDDLLERLANAPEDILSDVPLIEGLEATKLASKEINAAVEEGKKTEIDINLAREIYRPVASEGAMLYFLLTKLCNIEHMYQYSLDSFVSYFFKSIQKAIPSDKIPERVANLRNSLRITIYTMVSRGLFVRHKLIFLAQLTFNLMKRGNLGEENLLNETHFQFLLRGPRKEHEECPLSWLPKSAWDSCQALAEMEEFNKFPVDLVEAAPRFREWFNHITPESEKLPLDWAGLDRTPFQKMLVVRCLRPDRIATALLDFIRVVLPDGNAYADCDGALSSLAILDSSYADSSPTVPIYFILSPGANVMGDLDSLAIKYGFVPGETYHNVSMGQGQDVIAMRNLEMAHRQGHWVVLNNVHLMPRWLIELEKKLDDFALEGSHKKFRLFLSSDASNSIPIGLLNRCIKITNEPPAGLKANIKRAFASLNKESFEDYDSKMKSILFGLCHFHAIMLERKQYGPMGFNMMYPFSIGDLRDSAVVLANYMENSGGGKIPWADLRYIFGEIMYGGHIVNDFDRKMCNTYLDFFMKDELLDETEMFPYNDEEKSLSFLSPAPTTYDKYLEYMEANLTHETPIAFGLHPNAEIDFRTTQSNRILSTIMDLQDREASSGEGASPDEQAQAKLIDLMDRFGEKKYDVEELIRGLEEQGPYQNVFIQEMDVMNNLLSEIVRSLKELQLGFDGELTMSDSMEVLKNCLYLDRIPPSWQKRAWPSLRSLSSWVSDFTNRLIQLDAWQDSPTDIPKVVTLSSLVNPQSFLTAICQVTAQKNQWELDKLVTWTDVTKKMSAEEIESVSRDGAYIQGLFLQGARWDTGSGSVERSKPKEMFCRMPIMNVRALAADKIDTSNGIYVCPTYKTEFRGPTFVFCAQLKTKYPSGKWVLAGVALIMDVQ